MADYKEEIKNTADNLSYLNRCLERYKEENPKDFSALTHMRKAY